MENNRIQHPEANRDRKLGTALSITLAISLLGACGPMNSQVVSREKLSETKPAETSPANTPLPSPERINPTLIPLPTETKPTVIAASPTPEVIIIPDFALKTGNGYLDLGKPFVVTFSEDHMDLHALPMTASTGDEISKLNELFAAKDSWKSNPELFGVIESGYDQMFVGETHSGEVRYTIPSNIGKDDPTWLSRWMEANPGKDPDKVQEVEMPGQILVEKFEEGTLLGMEITLTDINGARGKLKVVDAREIEPDLFLNSNPPGEDSFIPLSKLVDGWSSPGITFVVCSDRNQTTKEFEKRLLVVTNLMDEGSK